MYQMSMRYIKFLLYFIVALAIFVWYFNHKITEITDKPKGGSSNPAVQQMLIHNMVEERSKEGFDYEDENEAIDSMIEEYKKANGGKITQAEEEAITNSALSAFEREKKKEQLLIKEREAQRQEIEQNKIMQQQRQDEERRQFEEERQRVIEEERRRQEEFERQKQEELRQ